MFNWFTARSRRRRNAQNFYGSIVALSRAPALYCDFNVPDTVEGRFEILVLHMFVALERLGHENGNEEKINQVLVNIFFADMDTTSRELGVGDLKVPKKMRVLAAVFEERIAAYTKAFLENDLQLLRNEFEQNIFIGNTAARNAAKELVGYVQTLRSGLADMSISDCVRQESDSMRKLLIIRRDK